MSSNKEPTSFSTRFGESSGRFLRRVRRWLFLDLLRVLFVGMATPSMEIDPA